MPHCASVTLERGTLHAAFRIEQEGAGGHHAFSRFQAAADFHPVALLPAGLHLAQFVLPAAQRDEDALRCSRIDYGVGVDGEGGRRGRVEVDVDDHSREEIAVRIVYFEPQLSGASLLVELRSCRRHSRLHRGQSRHADSRRGDGAEEGLLSALYVGQNPDAVEIRDAVEQFPFHEPLAHRHVALQDLAAGGRGEVDVEDLAASPAEVFHLLVPHADELEVIARRRELLRREGQGFGGRRLGAV